MHLVSVLSANVLALSLAVLSDTAAAAPNRVEEFCDWQPGQELNTVQNTVRLADTTYQEPSLEYINSLFSPGLVDGGRVMNVGVHMHVVGKPKNNECEFLVDRTTLDKQLDFLNKSFKPANISFTLSSVDWTKGVMGAKGYSLLRPLAKSLHRGNFSELNIFFCDAGEKVGGATMTLGGFHPNGDGYKSDGCVINANTVPGGSHPVWNLGVTVVHEVGHWFGLPHTAFIYPGDCTSNANEPCGARCDSNYMSYGDDACLQEFTPWQIADMRIFAREKRGL